MLHESRHLRINIDWHVVMLAIGYTRDPIGFTLWIGPLFFFLHGDYPEFKPE